MVDQAFKDSKYGRLLSSAAGVSRPMKICTFGTSHMTAPFGFGYALAYALSKIHDADVIFYHRQVLTSVADATVLANRGQAYATPSATSAHMVGAQLTQFNTDVAAGMRADIMFTDGGLYNDAPNNQAALDLALSRTLTVIDAFFDPAGNDGVAVGVYGLFGLNPSLCSSWANMWRRQEVLSGGRIRFLDVMPPLADRTNTSGTSWAWKGGTAALGASSHDSVHISSHASRQVAPLIADFLRDVCPRKFQWPGGFNTGTPDPANKRWMNMLGNGSALIGSNGLLNSGSVPGTIAGTGASGLADRWDLGTSNLSGATVTPSVAATGPNGEREQTLALSGVSSGGFITFNFQSNMTNINQSDAARRYMIGIEMELIGVTGFCHPILRPMGSNTWDTPNDNAGGVAANGLPDATSETYRVRSLYPVLWTGDNPTFRLLIIFRAATLAGSIKLRNPFLVEVAP